MIGVALANADARHAIAHDAVVLADRMRRAQAVENPAATVVVNVVDDVSNGAAAGMNAAVHVVMNIATADGDVGALLKADRVAAIMRDLDGFNFDTLRAAAYTRRRL